MSAFQFGDARISLVYCHLCCGKEELVTSYRHRPSHVSDNQFLDDSVQVLKRVLGERLENHRCEVGKPRFEPTARVQ